MAPPLPPPGVPPTGEPVDYVVATAGDSNRANYEAQLLAKVVVEGRGGPIGLRGEGTPLAARVIAVADA